MRLGIPRVVGARVRRLLVTRRGRTVKRVELARGRAPRAVVVRRPVTRGFALRARMVVERKGERRTVTVLRYFRGCS